LNTYGEQAVSPQHGRVFSADRDEKIRVSDFPNTSSVSAFCLGHTQYVSCLAVVSEETLLSGGGDGFVRAWHSATGKELAAFDLRTIVSGLIATLRTAVCPNPTFSRSGKRR
jgi:tRNA (guanine-N(7)-)-methyltransferase subunit TRM82